MTRMKPSDPSSISPNVGTGTGQAAARNLEHAIVVQVQREAELVCELLGEVPALEASANARHDRHRLIGRKRAVLKAAGKHGTCPVMPKAAALAEEECDRTRDERWIATCQPPPQ